MEKTQENIVSPFLRNNKIIQVQKVTIAHICIFLTNSIKMSIFIKKKTHVDEKIFLGGQSVIVQGNLCISRTRKTKKCPTVDLGALVLIPG